MTVRVSFFPDYFAGLPLWSDDERDAEQLIRDEAIPEDLVDRLRKWCEEWQERPLDQEWRADFENRGRTLADELAAHLGRGYVIDYQP